MSILEMNQNVFNSVFVGKKVSKEAKRAIEAEMIVPASAIEMSYDEMEYIDGGGYYDLASVPSWVVGIIAGGVVGYKVHSVLKSKLGQILPITACALLTLSTVITNSLVDAMISSLSTGRNLVMGANISVWTFIGIGASIALGLTIALGLGAVKTGFDAFLAGTVLNLGSSLTFKV